jgi:hypothetical protein
MTRYAFFLNNQCTALAESEEEKNMLLGFRWGAVIKSITEDQFINAKNYKSLLILNGENIEEKFEEDRLYLNNPTKDVEISKKEITNLINVLYLPFLTNYCLANENDTYWTDYKEKIQSISVDSLSFPLEYETFQEWFNNQPNYPKKSLLQCP